MSTAIKKTTKKKPSPKKSGILNRSGAKRHDPRRIRPEVLPETATYGTFAGKEYVMIPVEDFGEWYDDVTLGAIAQDRLEMDDEPPIPIENITDLLDRKAKRTAKK